MTNQVLGRIASKARSLWISLWRFFAGGIVVGTAYYANFVDLKQPNVSVEITEIQQVTAAEIDLTATPAFPKARKLLLGEIPARLNLGRPLTFKLENLEQGVSRVKQKIVDDRERLLKYKERYEQLPTTPDRSASSPLQQENQRIPLRFLDEDDIESINSPTQLRLVNKQLEDQIKSQEKLIAGVEQEIKAYKEQAEKTDAKIILVAAVSNSGDGSTTLKPQALLRADLGQSNYLDIYLRVVGYETGVAEIKPRGTNILKFESQPIGSMAPQDKERFINFFKNTSPTNLYVADVKGNYHISNTIPFAQGIYEQKIFDGLKTYAAANRAK